MTRLVAVVLGLFWCTAAGAVILDASLLSNGNLATAQTAGGASTNILRFNRIKNRTLVVTMNTTAGTGTAQLEINCNGTTTGAAWALVAGSSTALAVGTPVALSVVYPGCDYRTNVTICTSCSVNVDFWVGPEIQ